MVPLIPESEFEISFILHYRLSLVSNAGNIETKS
jgi:hypothetical protein